MLQLHRSDQQFNCHALRHVLYHISGLTVLINKLKRSSRLHTHPAQLAFSPTFRELSKIFSWNLCISEIVLLMRISSWNLYYALGSRTEFLIEILTINVISAIVYFCEIILGSLWNISETTPRSTRLLHDAVLPDLALSQYWHVFKPHEPHPANYETSENFLRGFDEN